MGCLEFWSPPITTFVIPLISTALRQILRTSPILCPSGRYALGTIALDIATKKKEEEDLKYQWSLVLTKRISISLGRKIGCRKTGR